MRVLVLVVIIASIAVAATAPKDSPQTNGGYAQEASEKRAAIRIEGEKRFQTNCGRCHLSPHKFPPKMMATVVRHMRVRALITDEDMRYILNYLTE